MSKISISSATNLQPNLLVRKCESSPPPLPFRVSQKKSSNLRRQACLSDNSLSVRVFLDDMSSAKLITPHKS